MRAVENKMQRAVNRSPAARPRSPDVGNARYLTLQEAADLCRSPKETIRHWVWEGRLKAYKPGRALLLREDELRAFLENSETVLIRARKQRGQPR